MSAATHFEYISLLSAMISASGKFAVESAEHAATMQCVRSIVAEWKVRAGAHGADNAVLAAMVKWLDVMPCSPEEARERALALLEDAWTNKDVIGLGTFISGHADEMRAMAADPRVLSLLAQGAASDTYKDMTNILMPAVWKTVRPFAEQLMTTAIQHDANAFARTMFSLIETSFRETAADRSVWLDDLKRWIGIARRAAKPDMEAAIDVFRESLVAIASAGGKRKFKENDEKEENGGGGGGGGIDNDNDNEDSADYNGGGGSDLGTTMSLRTFLTNTFEYATSLADWTPTEDVHAAVRDWAVTTDRSFANDRSISRLIYKVFPERKIQQNKMQRSYSLKKKSNV